MFGRSLIWRHAVLAVVIAAFGILGFLGLIGNRNRAERFDAKTVFVQPAGDGGVRITEVVDQDFGSNSRHGYQRLIPNDFGVPTDVEASSPDANAEVSVTSASSFETRVRLGSADESFTGQHRYVLSYTLPDAQLDSGRLALDIVDNAETLETGEFSVVLVGFGLDGPMCNVGSFGASGGCTLAAADDATLRATIAPLAAGDGITVGGRITALDPNAALPAFPALAPRHADMRLAVGLILLGTGLLVAATMYFLIRRLGRNEVAAGGAADAAYAAAGASTSLVPDDRMDRLATTEFVPPAGIYPWHGTVLLREQVGPESVSAWFSEWVAKDVLVIEDRDGSPRMRKGAAYDQVLDPATRALLDPVVGGGEIQLGRYNKSFATLWGKVRGAQIAEVRRSGWWRKLPPGSSSGSAGSVVRLVAVLAVFAVFAGHGLLKRDLLASSALAVGACIVVVGGLAAALYWFMIRSRSAVGSGLAIRTESFRRFLDASEGQHVDWAWQQGLLREYSAWAVALGAAEAWGRALAASNVPPAEARVGNPLIVSSMHQSFVGSATAPSSSGSRSGGGFGGGFSGGSVGGGGGGGSSGSW